MMRADREIVASLPRGASRLAAFSVAYALVAIGCAGDPPARAHTTVTDSAGVRIATTVLPLPDNAPVWLTDSAPSVIIGDGRSLDHELDRVGRAVRLSDGRIVVANGRPLELRVFDSTGAFVTRIGRAGDGPGEFRGIGTLQRWPGDSLFVLDPTPRRLSVFAPDGRFVRSGTIAPQAGQEARTLYSMKGVLDDGSVVAEGSRFDPGTGIVIPTSYVARTSPSLDSARIVGEFPGDHMLFTPTKTGMFAVGFPMFGRITRYVVDGDQFIVANNDTWEIRRYDRDGGLRTIVRVAGEPRRLTGHDYDVVIDSMMVERPEGTAAMRELWRQEISHYETLPAYSAVLADPDHNLWVRDYGRPGEDRSRWTVFDRDGAFLAFAETPVGARVLEVGRGYVLVLARGTDDEERVHLHRLTRAPRH